MLNCTAPVSEYGVCAEHRAEEVALRASVEAARDYDLFVEYPPAPVPPKLDGLRGAAGSDKYGKVALEGILDDAMKKADGRNVTLNRAAFRVGQLIRDGHVHWSDGASFCERLGQEMNLPKHEIQYILYRGKPGVTPKAGSIIEGMKS